MTEREIRNAVAAGATTFKKLREELGVAASCGRCSRCVRGIVRDELSGTTSGELALARIA